MKWSKWFVKFISWILFLLSILLPTFDTLYFFIFNEHALFCQGVCFMGLSRTAWTIVKLISFVILGFISHLLIKKYRSAKKKGGKLLYILTYPAYILPKICIWLVIVLFNVIVKLIGYFISTVINNNSNDNVSESQEKIYVVYEQGNRRELFFIERKTDYDSKPPYYGKYYNRFKDDLGNIWRSYDGNKTFIKEKLNGNLSYG